MRNRSFIIWHILGVACFLALPIILSPHPPEEKNFLYSMPTLRDFISNLLMIAFFYANYYYFIPKLFLSKRYTIYGILIFAAFGMIILLPSFLTGVVPWHVGDARIMPTPDMPVRPENVNFITVVNHNILLFVSVILFSILLKVRERLFKVEAIKNEMEINTLKSQINPHFLFNTLNSIYALALRDHSPDAANGIFKLSGLMRYVVTEADEDFVPLKKELNYIDDFIELQKMRLGPQVELNYKVEGDTDGKYIAPLLLIPYIENAFKHGVNPDVDSRIDIHIKITDEMLSLVAENSKVAVTLEAHEKSGYGMDIAKSRLRLLYPSLHQLNLKDSDKTYRVELTLNIDNDKSHRHR
ncbi:sensor histidine kinase [Fulvivirga ulvae]|uniref:sensor histidine kinase n=1 Tax=Fulvivirga ulvae TaxID=2904245 RepID=UPI001F1C5C43|nr:histidine kinase [Fulvivirga ulvae]UII31055.1 sensor histidine kinase [Fulvivirga ulvae]